MHIVLTKLFFILTVTMQEHDLLEKLKLRKLVLFEMNLK